jgi:hypothetical protein
LYISQINRNEDREFFINQNQIIYITSNNKNIDTIENNLKSRDNEKIIEDLEKKNLEYSNQDQINVENKID